jgi:hypothetical protein
MICIRMNETRFPYCIDRAAEYLAEHMTGEKIKTRLKDTSRKKSADVKEKKSEKVDSKRARFRNQLLLEHVLEYFHVS